MRRGRIGVDVGSTAVRAAELSLAGGVPALVRAAQVPVHPGAVEDGEVRQPEVVGAALRELWRRGGFRSRQVILGVGNQRCVVREVSVPWLPERELRKALGFQVQDFIPMAVEEAVLDYDLLGEHEQEGRRMVRLLLVAAQKAMVEGLVDAARAGRLEPVGIDLVPLALVRSVGTVDGEVDLAAGGLEAVVDFGAQVTSICVHDRRATRFVRFLPAGGHDITRAVALGLGLSDEVAERAKRGEVLEGGPDPAEVRRIALSRATGLADEVRSSLEFFAAQAAGARVERVVVTGGGSQLAGFLDLLKDRIPAAVERGHAFGRVQVRLDLSAESREKTEPVLAVAVGLALPGRPG